MRRRLTAAMILLVLGSLLLSGLVSLALVVHNTKIQTRNELVREAQGLATTVQQEAESNNRTDPARALRSVLLTLKSPMRLNGSAVLAVGANGQLFDPAMPRVAPTLPPGLTASDLQPASLLSMHTVTGYKGGLVFAAVPYRAEVQILGAPRQVLQVVVLTRTPPSALATAGLWFALSSAVILVIAGLVAYRLGRRFVRPIRAAEAVTGRIAAGDLDARVPVPRRPDAELAAMAASVNAMAARLVEAKTAEQHFLQSVSHELRTPLTSIRGFAEAIEDGATVNPVAAAGVIAAEAKRLERLVGDLLRPGHDSGPALRLADPACKPGRLNRRDRSQLRSCRVGAGPDVGRRLHGDRRGWVVGVGAGRPRPAGPGDDKPHRERPAIRHP